MLLKIFNGRNVPLQLIIIVAYLSLILFIPIQLVENNGFNPLYSIIYSLLSGEVLLIKVSFIVLVLLLLLLTQVYSISFGLFKRHHYHFLFVAPLLMFSYPNAWSINPVIISMVLVIVGINQLFRIGNKDKANEELAYSAITFSIASLIYTVLLWDIVLLLLALFLFRQFSIREVFITISSFVLPYIYLFSWFFIKGNLGQKWDSLIDVVRWNPIQLDLNQHWYQTMFNILVLIFIVMVSLSVFSNIRSKLIQIRTYISFLFFALLFSSILLLFSGFMTSYHYVFVLFSIAVLASILFAELKKNWIYEGFIALFLIHNLFLMYQILYA